MIRETCHLSHTLHITDFHLITSHLVITSPLITNSPTSSHPSTFKLVKLNGEFAALTFRLGLGRQSDRFAPLIRVLHIVYSHI